MVKLNRRRLNPEYVSSACRGEYIPRRIYILKLIAANMSRSDDLVPHSCPGRDALNQELVEDDDIPFVFSGSTAELGFDYEDLLAYFKALGEMYDYDSSAGKRLFMLQTPLIVKTSQLVGAFTLYPWDGDDDWHIYHGFAWYPLPPHVGFRDPNFGLRVAIFQLTRTSKLRYITLDFDLNEHEHIDDYYQELMQTTPGAAELLLASPISEIVGDGEGGVPY